MFWKIDFTPCFSTHRLGKSGKNITPECGFNCPPARVRETICQETISRNINGVGVSINTLIWNAPLVFLARTLATYIYIRRACGKSTSWGRQVRDLREEKIPRAKCIANSRRCEVGAWKVNKSIRGAVNYEGKRTNIAKLPEQWVNSLRRAPPPLISVHL